MKKRIEIIDLIKALTIVLVVWGHVASNLDSPFYRRVIYSFHMPLFFILAGMSMNIRVVSGFKEWKNFLKRNFLALMVPYFIWGLIFSQSTYDNITKLLYGSWEALDDMNTLTVLWFLPCLFLARIIVQAAVTLTEKHIKNHRTAVYAVTAAVLLALGIFVSHYSSFGGKGCFWCSDISIVAAGFIIAGILLKKPLIILAQQKAVILTGIFVFSLVLFFGAMIICPDSLILMRMCAREYGTAFWFFYYTIFGSLVVITLAMLLDRAAREGLHPFSVSYITFIGSHTMGIYLIHKPLLQNLVYPCVSFLLPNVNDTITSLLSALIMIPVSCAICVIIGKFIPELLGQFPREIEQ